MKVRLCREFLIFNKKNNAPHLLQATFSLLVLLRGKKKLTHVPNVLPSIIIWISI